MGDAGVKILLDLCLPRLNSLRSLDLSGTCDVLAVCRELRDIHWLVRSSGGMLPLDGRGLGGTGRAQGRRGREREGQGGQAA